MSESQSSINPLLRSMIGTEATAGPSPTRGRATTRRFLRRELWSPTQLTQPLLVVDSDTPESPIPTVTLQTLDREVRTLDSLGIGSVKLFATGQQRDKHGSEAASPDSTMMAAIAITRAVAPEMVIMTENCMCSFTEDRSCCLRNENGTADPERTIEVLQGQAVLQAEHGADIIGPASMLAGATKAVRDALDRCGYSNVALMPHLIVQSRLYDHYRKAMNAVPRRGNRAEHQLDPTQPRAAMDFARQLIDEGADMLLMEPAAHTIDLTTRLAEHHATPLVPFSVSGEYVQLTAGGTLDLADYHDLLVENLNAQFRAGAHAVITYAAKEAARSVPRQRRP